MPFDASGNFNRLRSWVSDANASIKIRADFHDDEDNNFASGLSNCITKDGRTQPIANIPMNQKRLTNVGEPDQPSDVATKNYVDNIKSYATGLSITGANYPNGMLTYTATTGMTGLAFANSQMSWLSKPVDLNKFPARLAATNSDLLTTGTEVFSIDRQGNFGSATGTFTYNMSNDGTNWRVDKTGIGSLLKLGAATLTVQFNEPATVQDNQVGTIKDLFAVTKTNVTHTSPSGHSMLGLYKKDGTGGFVSRITGGTATTGGRWALDLGNSTTETGGTSGTKGSDYALYAYDNSGASPRSATVISRETLAVTFYGTVNSPQNFQSTSASVVLAGTGGGVFLRPFGATSSASEAVLDNTGTFLISTGDLRVNNTNGGSYLGLGQQGRAGMYGSYTGSWHNWQYNGDGYIYSYINNTLVGAVQMVCDHRTKRDVAPLGSTWDAVKALQPVSYRYKGVPELLPGDTDQDEERWGFVAHELQEKLLPSAATFTKDAPDKVQSPNLMAVVAALTKTLQEAQARIEALEAKLA